MDSLFLYLISKESFETITIEFDVGCVCHMWNLLYWNMFSLYLVCWVFNHGWMLNLSNTFSASVDHVIFIFLVYQCDLSHLLFLIISGKNSAYHYSVWCYLWVCMMPFTWLKMILTKSSLLHIFIMKSLHVFYQIILLNQFDHHVDLSFILLLQCSTLINYWC